jgi:hypothetical protein
MKQANYGREIEAAIKACPQEARALESARAEAERLNSEKAKALQALEAIRKVGGQFVTEKHIIGGVEVEIQRRVYDDETTLLNSHIERLDHKLRRQTHEIESAKRRLSQAVANKLSSVQADLRRRTEEAIEIVTRVCSDGEALEDAMRGAGLDPDTVYAVRYSELQTLRVDQVWTRGQSIRTSLKEAA